MRLSAKKRFEHPKKPAYGFMDWYAKCPAWELEEILPSIVNQTEREDVSAMIASKNSASNRKAWRGLNAAINRAAD